MLLGQRWFLRWSGSITSWHDRFGGYVNGPQRHARIALMIGCEVTADNQLQVESWVERPGGRDVVLAPSIVPCQYVCQGSVIHVDACDDSGRLVACSFDQRDGRLLYGQSTLLQQAGFAVGDLDPPTLAEGQRPAERAG